MPWWDGLNVKDFVIELILKHAIGRYVKEINKSMFKVNISKGRAEVVNLEIRPDALDAFRLPYRCFNRIRSCEILNEAFIHYFWPVRHPAT